MQPRHLAACSPSNPAEWILGQAQDDGESGEMLGEP
jgi:hypothetical protein